MKNSPISKYRLVFLVGGTAMLFLYLVVQVFINLYWYWFPEVDLIWLARVKPPAFFGAGNVVEYLRSHELDQYANTMINLI